MSQTFLPPEWLQQLTDPYAVLGVSVAADERRITKRYRTLAKLLHPDRYANTDKTTAQLATAVFTRLINPAQEKLKHHESRADIVAMLRSRSRRWENTPENAPHSELGQQLMQIAAKDTDVFYEQAIAKLAEQQYQSLQHFHHITAQISELNLVYLHLQTADLLIREKRTGIIPATEKHTPSSPSATTSADSKTPAINYSQLHYQRATQYGKQNNWASAVSEMRDALKLDPNNSNYHALIGFAYLKQDLTGMATAHIRQALKLDPQQPLALKSATILKLKVEPPTPQANAKPSGLAGLLHFFSLKKDPQSKAGSRH